MKSSIETKNNNLQLLYIEYPVLGVRVLIKSDIEEILQLAESRFGHWRNLSQNYISPNPPLTVTIYKSSISSSVSGLSNIQYKADAFFLSAKATGVAFTADRRSGMAEAYVNPKTADLSDFFRINILECMVLFLITSSDREPLHASAVIRDQTALLFCGNSGSGKTTLAYNIFKRGADILADSATYISIRNGIQLWGDPLGFNFNPNARELFPELLNIPEIHLPDGRIKIPYKLSANGESDRCRLTFFCNILIIFPEQIESDQSSICEISRKEMIKRLMSNRESGFDLSQNFKNTIFRLPEIQSFSLKAGRNLLQTTEILESLFY
jgi:hypothetical protein